MRTPTEVKNAMMRALAAVADTPLRQSGFVRGQSSMTYSRILDAAGQKIIFAIEFFPKFQPSVDAHIRPMLQLTMPEVSERALVLVKNDRSLLAGAPEIILNQPIQFTASKDQHQWWFATGNDGFVAACASICGFVSRWVLPFLSEVSTPADLVRVYETNDERMMKQRHWHIFVAAAYQLLGKEDKAHEVVLRHFGSRGLRKVYSALFASLGAETQGDRL